MTLPSGLLTRRGWGLLASAGALWGVSRLLGIPELSMVALAALVLLALAVLATQAASATLSATRTVATPRLHHGQSGEVEVWLRNEGRLPTALLQVEDGVPATLADDASAVLAPLPPGRRAAIRYEVTGRLRGHWEFGPVRVWIRDPFGLVARPRPVAADGAVTVYPPVVELPRGLPLSGHLGSGTSGRPRPGAHGDDLAMVREYVRGDDLRKVHWRSTAHRGQLMVRQDESPQSPTATLVLDLREGHHAGVGAASSLEYAVTAAASIAVHLATRAYAVTLLTQPAASPPAPMDHEVALERLAVVEPVPDGQLDAIWTQMASGVGATGSLIAVVTTPTPRELRTMVRAGRHFPSRTALLVDAGSFRRRRERDDADADAAVAALRAAGWRVGRQRAGERLDHVWQELVVQRGRAGIG